MPAVAVPAPMPPGHRWLWPVMLAAMIFVASGQSAVASPGWLNFDKAAHFAVFGLLGTLITRTQPPRRWWWGVVIASLYGIGDEYRQSFTPGRSVEFDDWLADTAGALVAVSLYARSRAYRAVLEWKLLWGRRQPVAKPLLAASDANA